MPKYKLEAEIEVDLNIEEIAQDVDNPVIRIIDKKNKRARSVKILQMSFKEIEAPSTVEEEEKSESDELRAKEQESASYAEEE